MPRTTKAQELEATVMVINRLAREKKEQIDAVTGKALTSALANITQPEADNVLLWALNIGRQPAAAQNGRGAAPDAVVGLYRKDDTVYLVQKNRQGTRSYALQFVPGARKVLVMASGVVYELKPEHMLKPAEAKRLCRDHPKLGAALESAQATS